MAEPKPAAGTGRFAFLDSLRDLPSLPQVLVKISRVASDPKATAAGLSDVILRDQALTLKILRIANSARYALYAQRVTTVSRAVMVLGFQSVRAVALGLGSFHLLSALERGGRVLEQFWRDAMATAVICQEMAGLFGMAAAEEAFVAGLLHDVGKLILAEHDPKAVAALYVSEMVGPALLAGEKAAFGVDHTEVAGELGRRWELPEVLQKAMTQHHRHFAAPPVDRGDLLAFLVGASKTVAATLGTGSEDLRDLASKMARVLRKPVGPVLGALKDLPEKIRTYAGFFEIDVNDLKAYTLWVEGENQKLADAFTQQEEERLRLEARRAEMAAIREVHAMLVQGDSADAVARRVLRASREIAGSRRAVVALPSEADATLAPAWADGDVTPQFLGAFRFPVEEQGVFAEVLRGGQPIHVFDANLTYFKRLLNARETKTLDTPCFAVLPLVRGGQTAGVLYADRSEGDEPFTDEEMESLAALADLVGLALRS
jgi:putative nucleotidyltransferase with HDIG domain